MLSRAIAHANVALIKYWGKRDERRNIPAVGSLSVTLDRLWTQTTVEFQPRLRRDRLFINGQTAAPQAAERIVAFLDEVRRQAANGMHCEMHTTNNFPTSAGLASSASGFAALALAASDAAGLDLTPPALSTLARRGSGSAARSIFGGFVEIDPDADMAREPTAVQIADEQHWPLSVLVVITANAPKRISSRDAMAVTQQQAPYYGAWVHSAKDDLAAMRRAVQQKDLQGLGNLAEHSALKLHGLMMSTKPGLLYWNPATVAVIHKVRHLREKGLSAYFTIDAGPQVKVICDPPHAPVVAEHLLALPGVRTVSLAGPGPSAHLVEVT
jgi:diphosphomevalonate decarboxylase